MMMRSWDLSATAGVPKTGHVMRWEWGVEEMSVSSSPTKKEDRVSSMKGPRGSWITRKCWIDLWSK